MYESGCYEIKVLVWMSQLL